MRAQVGGQLSHLVLQGGLGSAHDVVSGEDAARGLEGQGEDGAAVAGHERGAVPDDGDQGVGADVQGDAESLPLRVHEGSPQVIAVGEGEAVDDDVQASELLGHPFECGLDVVVGAYVALNQRRVLPGGHQLGDVLPHPIVLVAHGEPGPRLMEDLGYGPGDTPVVGDTEDDAGFAC